MAHFSLPIGRPALMGILNVTPDSFSDGGTYFSADVACVAGLKMMHDGADLIDVGGESTRPGAESVSAEEEMRRVLPVVASLARDGVPVSIDTSKAQVAQAALDMGATIVNDVTAFSDPDMARVCAKEGCTVCLMHMQGQPRTMQHDPRYADVVSEVTAFLSARAKQAEVGGIAKDRIWIDPGIGFGKTIEHNLELLRRLDELGELGYPVLVGISRKAFIGKLLGSDSEMLPVGERLEGTLAAQVFSQLRGARIIRAHDVKATRRAIDMTAALTPS